MNIQVILTRALLSLALVVVACSDHASRRILPIAPKSMAQIYWEQRGSGSAEGAAGAL